MSFVSFEFVIFFSIVSTLYFMLPYRRRWILLLIGSYFFYGYWNPDYLILIIFSTLIDYLVARWVYRTPATQARKRRLLLGLSLTINLGVLFVFKYFNFVNQSVSTIIPSYNPALLDVLLPVGISFYTFQSMAYTIDVYRGKIQPENNLGIFATYIAFFPQLVAGPIERAGNMLPQFRQHFDFSYSRVVSGLRLILWGVFKKVIIADRVAMYVNVVYNDVESYTGWPLIIATFFFAFQIYCDFSAYSDIAIGAAKVLGFNLMDNFRQPYLSTSIREFWQRWHISLSTWFRDYLYISLGGNRVAPARHIMNLMIVFIISGLWHGAAWTFAIWGALHGLYLVGELLLGKLFPSAPARATHSRIAGLVRGSVTFVLVNFAWIFFRSNSIGDAGYVITHLFQFSEAIAGAAIEPFRIAAGPLPGEIEFIVALAVIILLMIFDWLDSRRGMIELFSNTSPTVRWLCYNALITMIAISLFIYGASTEEFIYFQF